MCVPPVIHATIAPSPRCVHARRRTGRQPMKDEQGHTLTGATAEAAALFDRALRAFNLSCGDPVALLDAACEAAPDFTMAHIAKAWLFILARDPVLAERIDALIATAAALPMNEREGSHFAARRQAGN